MSLIPNPEYDRPGFCCLCHTLIADFEGERIVKILSNARAVYMRMNDGSMMQVTLCAKCKDSMVEQDIPKIMESVYKGWKVELDKKIVAKEWTEEQRAEYLDRYGEKFIVECDEKGFREDGLKSKLGKLEGVLAIERNKAK